MTARKKKNRESWHVTVGRFSRLFKNTMRAFVKTFYPLMSMRGLDDATKVKMATGAMELHGALCGLGEATKLKMTMERESGGEPDMKSRSSGAWNQRYAFQSRDSQDRYLQAAHGPSRQWRMLPTSSDGSHASSTSSAKVYHNHRTRSVLVCCHHLVLSCASLCPAPPHTLLSPKTISSSARPLWRKHGPLTLLNLRVDTQACAWESRRTQDQPTSKETARKKNPVGGGPALTRRVKQFQEVRTPSREESRIYNLQTSRRRSPIT